MDVDVVDDCFVSLLLPIFFIHLVLVVSLFCFTTLTFGRDNLSISLLSALSTGDMLVVRNTAACFSVGDRGEYN